MSHLSEWVEAHGMTEHEAFRRSGISYQTWRWLMAGYYTMPCLALTCGKNLGMTPEEVKPLGKQFTAANFAESDMLITYPENFKEDWYALVTDYTPAAEPKEETRQFDSPKRSRYCVNCGRRFDNVPNQKYCPTCLMKSTEDESGQHHKLNIVYCNICGKKLKGNGTKYCSEACRKIAADGPANPKVCPCCGVIFISHNPNQKYCSKTCKKYAETGQKTPIMEERKCACCGTVFVPKAKRVHLYCSDYCRSKARSQKLREERAKRKEALANESNE